MLCVVHVLCAHLTAMRGRGAPAANGVRPGLGSEITVSCDFARPMWTYGVCGLCVCPYVDCVHARHDGLSIITICSLSSAFSAGCRVRDVSAVSICLSEGKGCVCRVQDSWRVAQHSHVPCYARYGTHARPSLCVFAPSGTSNRFTQLNSFICTVLLHVHKKLRGV